MISSDQSRLPEEFQEVEWLMGSGSQYCRLPYKLGFQDGHFYGMKGDLQAVNGTRYSEIWIESEYGLPTYVDYGYWGARLTYGDLEAGYFTEYKLKVEDATDFDYHFEINSTNVKINNTISNKSFPQRLGDNITIGAGMNTSGNLNVHNSNVMIKSIIITYDGQNLYELIPCYRVDNNKAGFFYWIDHSQGTSGFITNSASGSDFLTGPDV